MNTAIAPDDWNWQAEVIAYRGRYVDTMSKVAATLRAPQDTVSRVLQARP